ncbi:MAG: AraC family transcriptional regulator N-terminal domain-containing protein [Coriobacteriia bacterium]
MPEHAERRRLAELLAPLTNRDGFTATPVPGVQIMRATSSTSRHPIVYTPRIVVVAQGRKCVWLGEEGYVYDANNYLVLSAPMPLECETIASEDEPLLGLTIAVDPVLIGELLLEMGDLPSIEPSSCVSSSALTEDVIDAAERLARALASPADARILGPQIVREIVYRVLLSDRGDVLRVLTPSGSRFGQIARVLRRIQEDYARDVDVASLAREANMAPSTFHQAFREMTATSPVQYVKRMRLHRARTLLAAEGLSAQDAARMVGYQSASQFSREYRRMFGSSPSEDRSVAISA